MGVLDNTLFSEVLPAFNFYRHSVQLLVVITQVLVFYNLLAWVLLCIAKL